MKILLLQGQGYRLVDPGALDESEFTAVAEVGLRQVFPEFECVKFTGTFELDGKGQKPDLALVARDRSHWFVVEVELTAHSLEGHVLPQVRTLRYGEPLDNCARILSKNLELEFGQTQTLVQFVPRSVVVVAEKRVHDWEVALRAHDVQLLAISPYKSPAGDTAMAIDGAVFVPRESLGIARYSVTDRSIRIPLAASLPEDGRVQIEDPTGAVAWWTIRRAKGVAWITREVGGAGVPHDTYVQFIRTMDGRLSLRSVGQQ